MTGPQGTNGGTTNTDNKSPDQIFEELFSGTDNHAPDDQEQGRKSGFGRSPQTPQTGENFYDEPSYNPYVDSQDSSRASTESRNREGRATGPGAEKNQGNQGIVPAAMDAVRKATSWMRGSAPGAQKGGSSDAPGDRSRGEPSGRTMKATTPEQLQGLEQRMKLSLRETSLSNIARIGVGSPKGGVGKSSTAYGIACSISYYTNMRVALVDADPNFGSTRLLVPRPIDASVVDLARDAEGLDGLSQLRSYIAQNEKMRLDVVLGPAHAYELAEFDDLGEAYERIDEVLARHYDVIVYDLGLGFRDPAIRRVLSLCNELLFVTDSEVIPNAMLDDGIAYIQHLGVDLDRTTLVINHRLPKQHESADTTRVRQAASGVFRHVTDIPYDDNMSQLLNRRAFHIESLTPDTRRGILTTLAACLEGLMDSTSTGDRVSGNVKKVS